MSYYDSKKNEIITFPDKDCGNGWIEVDCGCCGGIQWGGESPRECNDCKGTSRYFRHKKSRVLALYPGGPFIGREPLVSDNA